MRSNDLEGVWDASLLGSTLRVSELVWERAQESVSQFPGDAAAAGSGATLWEPPA